MTVPASREMSSRPVRTPATPSTSLRPDRLLRLVAAQRDLAGAAPDPSAVFDLLAKAVFSVFDADGAVALQPVGEDLLVRGTAGSCGPRPDEVVPQSGTLVGAALRSGRPQSTRDALTDARTTPWLAEKAGIRSAVAAPLLTAAGPIGVIAAYCAEPDGFSEEDLGLLDLLAGAAARTLNTAMELAARRADDLRLRAAQELTGLAWWTLDLRTGRHLWSEAMFRLTGLDPSGEAPTLAEFIALLHPEDRIQARALAEAGYVKDHRGVFRVLHDDGGVRYLQSWSDVEADADGTPLRVRGATMDVTDRELAAARLAASRAEVAAALELTRTATWEWDAVHDTLRLSERLLGFAGREAGDAPATMAEFLECVHLDDRARLVQLEDTVVAAGRTAEVQFRLVRPDTSVRHIRALVDVRLTSEGLVRALWGTAVDVTAQVEASARLSASEQHFRVAFDNAPIGMSMISLAQESQGHYLRANDAFLDMVGYGHDELAGLAHADLTHPEDIDRDRELLARLVHGEVDKLAFEKRYARKDGMTVHAWITTAVARGPQGEPLFLITHAIDVTERRHEQAELERLALTDTLTGLANRSLLTDRLDLALARLQRNGGACAMLLLDVDRFKLVNDSLGHLVGDALLIEVAGRVSDVSRADSTVARLGGDEFVVLVEGLRDPAEVHAIAQRLLATLRRPYDLGQGAEALVATVSIGVSVATSADRTHVDLYREADLALYRAKDSGRDQYALFDDNLRARAEDRMQAETLLRQALVSDALVAVLQPIVDLEDGQVHSAEGLVRLVAEDGSLIAPAAFIDVAEETGLIVELDARMFEMVVAQFAHLAADPEAHLDRVSTNVSARSLEDPGFVDRLRRALTWYSVPGTAVRVELTERSLLAESPAVRESMERMAQLGLQIGLDDFGTGYSALAYLQQFPLQFLKIDRSFVSRLGRSAGDDAVVSAVIDLAHAHDLQVVAEGVEEPGQLAALRAMGCDSAQGYLLGRPMSPADLEAVLHQARRW